MPNVDQPCTVCLRASRGLTDGHRIEQFCSRINEQSQNNDQSRWLLHDAVDSQWGPDTCSGRPPRSTYVGGVAHRGSQASCYLIRDVDIVFQALQLGLSAGRDVFK